MIIEYILAILAYIILLILAYEIIILKNSKHGKGEEIVNKSYNNAYSILVFAVLVVYAIIEHPHTTIDSQTTAYLILTSKIISVLTLGVSLLVLNRIYKHKH